MNLDPYNCLLKIWKSIKTLTPKVKVHLGVWGFISSLSYTLGSMKCDFRASLLAYTFASPCLGHEPKVKVATIHVYIIQWPYTYLIKKYFTYRM